jgi:hypothetical protein
MIVSHRHRFIFIKTQKTAGTAIEAALSELCGPSDIITPFRQASEIDRKGLGPQNYRIDHPLKPVQPLWRKLLRRPERYYHPTVGFYQHMPAWRVRAYLGEEIWQSYFKFAFERNPWDRQVSWYFDKTRSKLRRPSFERFMRDRRRAYVDNYQLYAINDEVAVNFLGQYERLEQDLRVVLRHLGIQKAIQLPLTNITGTRPNGQNYREVYTPHSQALVADWYAHEIALLGYKF